jgi:hypothetical protein
MSTATEPEARAESEPQDRTARVFKSRWGYHPCDRETFLELKEYHKLMLAAFRRYRRWAAWDRKTVHRVGPEPRKVERLTFKDRWSGQTLFATFEDANLYRVVLRQYRNARRPVADPSRVEPLNLPDGWRAEIETLRAELAAPEAPPP